MEHLQIAYDLFVIILGFAALSVVLFWASKTGDLDLRNFCILYALYTLVLIVLLLKKYLFLNVDEYSARWWYLISGVLQLANFAVLAATLHFLLGIFQVRLRNTIMLGFLAMTLLCYALIFSPIGAVLDIKTGTIRLGIGFRITSVWYIISFTFILVLGYSLIRRVWSTNRRNFMIGLLIFATVGYGETLAALPATLRGRVVALAAENNFLFSSVPYAVYGLFLINHFLHYHVPAVPGSSTLSEDFLTRYGITDREREIILKVVQGKSNGDIARELYISLATVKTHLHNIYKKTGVDSRYDLLARVRSEG